MPRTTRYPVQLPNGTDPREHPLPTRVTPTFSNYALKTNAFPPAAPFPQATIQPASSSRPSNPSRPPPPPQNKKHQTNPFPPPTHTKSNHFPPTATNPDPIRPPPPPASR